MRRSSEWSSCRRRWSCSDTATGGCRRGSTASCPGLASRRLPRCPSRRRSSARDGRGATTRSPDDAELMRRYVHAHESGDIDTVVAMLADDVRIAMPAEPTCLGVQAAAGFFRAILGPDRPGDWLLHTTHANGQPATANYLRRPGDI